jgi:hypothetical protein
MRVLVAVQRVAPAVGPLGLKAGDLEAVVGDVANPAAVERAVRGCEAVVHAGSVLSWTAVTSAASAR